MKKKSLIVMSAIIGIMLTLTVFVVLIAVGAFNAQNDSLIIVSGNADKFYDGNALSSNEWDILYGGLKQGHRVEANVYGSQVDVGESDNYMTAIIYDENGNDVSYEYDIEIRYGKLRVNPIQLTTKSGGGEKSYDGTPLTNDEVSLIYGELLSGHTIDFKIKGTQTNAGTSKNIYDVIINDEEGNDVSRFYQVSMACGELKVKPLKITVRTGSDKKEYDGEELRCESWELEPLDNMVEGHTLELEVTGSQTELGESENTVGGVAILDNEKNDVTQNYKINYQLGMLVVFDPNEVPPQPEPDPEEDTVPFPGEDYGNGDDDDTDNDMGDDAGNKKEEENKVVMRVFANESCTLYLRLQSYGSYKGTGWDYDVSAYDKLIDNQYSANYLTGLSLKNSGYISKAVKIDNPTKNYVLPAHLDMDMLNYVIQSNDIYNIGASADIYSAYYYNYNALKGTNLSGVSKEYREYERAYRQFVYENYLDVPKSTKQYMELLITQNGFDKSDSDIIAKVAKFIQGSATYNLDYDTALESESDIAVAFLSKYKEGVCRHYAAAATVLYRALGIPARYTIGYAAQAVGGEWSDVTVMNGHAWVEIYLDGTGWVTVEVTGGGAGGNVGGDIEEQPIEEDDEIDDGETPGGGEEDEEGEPKPGEDGEPKPGEDEETDDTNDKDEPTDDDTTDKDETTDDDTTDKDGTEVEKFVISGNPVKVEHKYDGSLFVVDPHGEISLKQHVDTYLEGHGYTYTYTLKGQQDGVGISKVEIDTFNVFDENGNDISENFEYDFKDADLHVYETELIVTSKSFSKVYDTTPLYSEADGYTFGTGENGEGTELLEDTHRLVVTFKSSATNVSSVVNQFSVAVMDGEENVDVRYKIIQKFGFLTISRRQITVEAKTASKAYDGTELVCDEWDIVEGSLCEGQTALVTIVGSQTVRGISDNAVEDVKIYDATGTEVTKNYIIVFKHGKLTVY